MVGYFWLSSLKIGHKNMLDRCNTVDHQSNSQLQKSQYPRARPVARKDTKTINTEYSKSP